MIAGIPPDHHGIHLRSAADYNLEFDCGIEGLGTANPCVLGEAQYPLIIGKLHRNPERAATNLLKFVACGHVPGQ
jgi:hypothetical protein